MLAVEAGLWRGVAAPFLLLAPLLYGREVTSEQGMTEGREARLTAGLEEVWERIIVEGGFQDWAHTRTQTRTSHSCAPTFSRCLRSFSRRFCSLAHSFSRRRASFSRLLMSASRSRSRFSRSAMRSCLIFSCRLKGKHKRTRTRHQHISTPIAVVVFATRRTGALCPLGHRCAQYHSALTIASAASRSAARQLVRRPFSLRHTPAPTPAAALRAEASEPCQHHVNGDGR